MRKIPVLLAVLVLITGCITVVETAEEPEELPPAPVREITVKEKVITPGEKPEPPAVEEKAPEHQLGPVLATLKEKADQKVSSYSFLYAPPPGNLAQDKWYIKGNKMKAELFGEIYYETEGHYDTVFLDAKEKTAYGYCLSEQKGECPEEKKRLILDYDAYIIKTPYQIVKSIPYGHVAGSEVLWDRSYQVAEYMKDNVAYKVWIDSFSGLASKLAMYDVDGNELKKYEFRHLQINNVADEEVTPPLIR